VSYVRLKDGSFSLIVKTPFFFGDRVKFDSPQPSRERKGEGKVDAIGVDEDGNIFYEVKPDGSKYIEGGIQQQEMTLIKK